MSERHARDRRRLERAVADVELAIERFVDSTDGLLLAKAPPGSGKTYLLVEGVARGHRSGQRVLVATQTNSQADDVCCRLVARHRRLRVVRLLGQYSDVGALPASVTVTRKVLPTGPCIVVANTQKWSFVDRSVEFDLAFVDEAWQMTWADFMPLGRVAGRFALIGDPGQIAPTVTSDVRRWETALRAPHLAAPEVIRAQRPELARLLEVPASRRLPHDAVRLVRPFYDFGFDALAEPGERYVRPMRGGRHVVDPAIDLLESGSVAGLVLPTPSGGPPCELDEEVARLAAEVVERLLNRGSVAGIEGKEAKLVPDDLGLVATQRVMLSAIDLALPSGLRGRVRVDTPERWQGLERKVMIAVHPLSGALRPSAFDLDTGRLCVMASRHKAGLVLIGRDHIGETLDELVTVADQPIGRPDVAGRGHAQHLAFWHALAQGGRVVRAA